jgi:hypothetical protein
MLLALLLSSSLQVYVSAIAGGWALAAGDPRGRWCMISPFLTVLAPCVLATGTR